MSYPRNAATPPRVAVGPVVQISDGAVQTSGVSIRVVPQGGSAAAGLGTTTYEDGIVLYAPTQAETNYEAFAIIAYKSGCIPASTTVVTSASATAGYGGVDWSKVTAATTTLNLSGTTIKTATDIETDTQDIQSRLPAALVSGRMDASVGAYQSGLTPLQPTVAGRTLDVSAGGEAGIDWANIGSPTSTVAFTNTTIATSQVVATVTNRVSANTDQWGGVAVTGMPMPTYTQPTGFLAATFPATVASTTNITTVGAVSGSVGSVTGNVGGNVSGSVGSISGVTFPSNFGSLAITVGGAVTAGTVSDKTGYSLASGGLASVTAWTVNITGSLSGSVGSVTGAVSSVTSGVTVTTNNDKTGYSLTQSFPSNFASLAITAGGAVTAGTVSDKTGYSLTQSFPTNFSSLAITAGGSVTAGTVSDKTGYSLTQAFPTNFSSMAISASGVVDANTVLWGGSTLPTVGTSTLTASQVWSHATRTLSAFGFTVSANVTQWNGGSLPTIGTSTLTAQQVWEYSTRTLSAFSFTVSANVTQWSGGSLPTIPTAGENADAVWDEPMSGHTGAGTYGGRIPRSDSANVNVKLTGSAHIAADVHELQPAVIEAQHFALGAIDANALAADASSEIATAVRAELATELARINVPIDSRLATIAYTAPPTATTVADAVLTRNVSNVENVAGTTTLCTLVLAGVGKALTVGGVLNIYRTNGTTVHATKTLTTDPNADPVTGIS